MLSCGINNNNSPSIVEGVPEGRGSNMKDWPIGHPNYKFLIMKRVLLYVICVVFGMNVAFGEASELKILYLIPFESDSYTSPIVRNSEDMGQVRSYQMMGFWNGAQMALEELSKDQNISFDIVVRDVSNNEKQLRAIMEDTELMRGVDLIIGPFFGKMFSIAAEYAKQYRIPIVNPFTSRRDFMVDNEYVFKLMPALESRPAMIAFMAQQTGASPIIIYGDSNSQDKEMTAFLRYFQENNVDFELIPNASSVVTRISQTKPSIVITFYNNPAINLIISRNLLYSQKTENLTFVVPESWLESKTYDIEYYSKLNLHFFSDYYIDYEAEKTKIFINDYTEKYGVAPSLASFSFKGYDITRYFAAASMTETLTEIQKLYSSAAPDVELVFNFLDLDRVKVSPIAFPFTFDKLPNGGYENVNVQFLEVKNNEIVPSGY